MNNKLSNRVSQWSILATADLHGKISEMENKGEKIIDLTIGISDLPIPKVGERAAVHAIETNHVPYTAIGGSNELKEALQKKLAKENKIQTKPSNIIVTTGAKQAIFESLYAITNPADEVILFTPYWPAYTQILTMLNVKPRFIPFSEIDSLNKIKFTSKLKAIIVNNPHNPTGKIFSPDELRNIAHFALKHNLYIIADESYEKLMYSNKHKSFAMIDKRIHEKLITIFSVSQSFSMMGWRLGYAVADAQIIKAMESVQSSITAATSAVTQTAVTKILSNQNDYHAKLQRDFQKRRNILFENIATIPWISCELPESGPYLWCNIKKLTKNSFDFAEKLLQIEKVAVMPGEAFGAPGWIRIAFNVQKDFILEKAAQKIERFGKEYHSG